MVPKVEVFEHYRGWKPALDLKAAVEGLLALTPPQYLCGLGSIVLSNSAGLPHDRRRGVTKARGKKVVIANALGLYHQAWKGQPAWIELLADNILARLPDWAWRLAPFRDWELCTVIFHELGHHIHATRVPEFRERESVAEDWADKLGEACYRQKHPIACGFGFLMNRILRYARSRAPAATRRVS